MADKFEPIKYGEEYKKISFYDSDKRHADLRIRLQYDGIKQSEFFRAVVTAYLEKEESFMAFLDKHMSDNQMRSENKRKKIQKANKKEKEVKSKFDLNEGEIDSIYDLLEEEYPELWKNALKNAKN